MTSLTADRTAFCLATVVEVEGSSSAPPGSKAVFDDHGRLLMGWVGGGCAEALIAHSALECLEHRQPKMINVDLMDEIFGAGMPCGGHMRVYVEPCHPNPVLWLLGRGTLVEYLCELAADMDFDVIVNDNSAHPEEYPRATQVIHGDDRYHQLVPKAGDLVVIATHHKGDLVALHQAIKSDANYIGLVASHHRTQLILERLLSDGLTPSQIKRIRAPAGLRIGSKGHREIALSIVAELISVRRSNPAR